MPRPVATPPRTTPPARPSSTFSNPVLPGFHPDPSICRVGEDFYLVTSSFEYFPGVPIFHSRDLVHWSQLGHVLTRPSQLRLHRARSSGGIYAPTIRHAHGRFYVITTNVSGRGNFYVTAPDPAGPWSDPVWLDREGIDPSLHFERGRVFYTRNGRGRDRDHPRIHQGVLVGARTPRVPARRRGRPPWLRPIWDGLGGIWPEGPHLFVRDGLYYLLTAEGGTSYDHSVVIVRGPSPDGPFESFPGNPILTHRDRPRDPFQALGHADFVELEDGSTWAVCLGIRPQGGRHHHLGRETFLAPVTWTADGWPVIGRRGRMSRRFVAPQLARSSSLSPPGPGARDIDDAWRDDFDASALRPEWSFLRNPRARDWSLGARPGALRLRGSAIALTEVDAPAFVGRRQQHFDCVVRVQVEFEPRGMAEEAGLAIFANENFHYTLSIRRAAPTASRRPGAARRVAVVAARVGGQTRVVGRYPLPDRGAVILGLRATASDYRFFVEGPTVTRRSPRLSTRHLSSETIWRTGQSFFTGVFLALFASGNGTRAEVPADFDWFEYLPTTTTPPPRTGSRRRVGPT